MLDESPLLDARSNVSHATLAALDSANRTSGEELGAMGCAA
jgi:hypothetical protein